jgi:glycosyltransferase involved in cell wall biosynthesis
VRRSLPPLLEQLEADDDLIVVDNGSSDGTAAFVRELAGLHPWISVIEVPGAEAALPGAPIVRAFHAGLERLAQRPDVIVKLDADVSMEPDYFERLLVAFEADPRLGIASGDCLELADGEWRSTEVSNGHARGAARAYRKACLQQVLPLEEHVGWDGIDELKANVLGWRTGIVPEVAFRHHRSVGERDGASYRRWIAQGRGAHFMGYRPSFILLRSLHRARREPVAVAMMWGYAAAVLRRDPRCADGAVRRHLREQQRIRHLARRGRP